MSFETCSPRFVVPQKKDDMQATLNPLVFDSYF